MLNAATATATAPTEQNALLAALPAPTFERIAAELELVALPLGKVLYEPDDILEYAYFPTSAVISLHYVLASGASAETAGVGNEGMVGMALFMGGDSTSSAAVVHTSGYAYRLPARVLKCELARGEMLFAALLRYAQALMTQIAQTAACYRHHSVEQQLCRWLLLTIDRGPPRELVMTQEQVARLLGVRREGITEAAGRLQRDGYIHYRRGHLAVIERAGLESRACECYAVVKDELQRLLREVRMYEHPPGRRH